MHLSIEFDGDKIKIIVVQPFKKNLCYYFNNIFCLENQIQMENENKTNTPAEDVGSVYLVSFILLLIVEIPSIACILIILPYFFCHWHSMMTKALHNHVIFLLIIVSFFYVTLDLPFVINHYRLGYDNFRKPSFCLWWYWLDYTLLLISLFLTATASVQRHILVFNSYWLRIHRKRWLLHFLPLIFCIVYPSIFYFISVFFYPCVTIFDENSLSCPFPCYTDRLIMSYIDWILHTMIPIMIIVVANIALVCRVIYSMRKIRHRRLRTWRKKKKLTLQLLAFSSLYIMGWSPSAVISLIGTVFLPNLYEKRPKLYYINNSSYFVCPLQPMICFFALPELMKFMKSKLR